MAIRLRPLGRAGLCLRERGRPGPNGAPPDAQASDPARLGWMVGSPPPADKIVRKQDGSFYRFAQLRWTFSNARQLGATTNVSRGLDSPSALPRAERADLDAVTFVPLGMT